MSNVSATATRLRRAPGGRSFPMPRYRTSPRAARHPMAMPIGPDGGVVWPPTPAQVARAEARARERAERELHRRWARGLFDQPMGLPEQ